MSTDKGCERKKGPRGGVKHQPGGGHDTKSEPQRKRRFARKAAKKRKEKEEAARRAWEEWDRLSDEAKKLLGPAGQPKMPRPKDER
jgi:hypothetical protein